MNAFAYLDSLIGPGWAPLFEDVLGGDPLGFPGYQGQLERARGETGCSESVLVAQGAIGDHRIVAIAFEFGFLGGSMGAAAGARIARAFELAGRENLPVVALIATGGARMQEGMHALAQMAATMAARARLRTPFIAYLRNPSTGGVYASFASSADLVWAEPDATVGFAGPRVAQAFTGEPLPPGSHTAEAALDAGLIDAIVEPGALADALSRALTALRPPAASPAPGVPPEPARLELSAWERVERARDPGRPTGVDHLPDGAPIRPGGDPATAAVAADGAIWIGMDRDHRPGPDAYRRVRHAVALAGRLGLPAITFVDTPGADPGAVSERDGIASAISQTFTAMLTAPVPTVAVVVGEGGSGGALALAAADRLLIQENAVFSVIAPEGAASILKRTDVAGVASDLRPTAFDLDGLGLADRVLPDGETGVAWALSDIAREGGAPTARRTARWSVLR